MALRILLIRVDFPEPDTPVTAMNFLVGKRGRDVLQVVLTRSVTSNKSNHFYYDALLVPDGTFP